MRASTLVSILTLGPALAGLFLTAGCNTKTEGNSSGPAASINGGPGAEAGKDAGPTAAPNDAKAATPAAKLHVVEVETDQGTFRIQLYPQHAPVTVDNFLRYVNEGFYDGTIFHTVLKNYVVIGGGYSAQTHALKKAYTPIYNEAAKCPLKNEKGTVGLVHRPDGPHAAQSQFYINLAKSPHLDYRDEKECGYCVFGEVLGDGMQVIDRIAQVKVKQEKDFDWIPEKDVVIRSVRQKQ